MEDLRDGHTRSLHWSGCICLLNNTLFVVLMCFFFSQSGAHSYWLKTDYKLKLKFYCLKFLGFLSFLFFSMRTPGQGIHIKHILNQNLSFH